MRQEGGIIIYILVLIDLVIISFAFDYFLDINLINFIFEDGAFSGAICIAMVTMAIAETLTLPKEN